MGPYALTPVSFVDGSPAMDEVKARVAEDTGLSVEVEHRDPPAASLRLVGDSLDETVPLRIEERRIVVDTNDRHPYAAAAVLRALVELDGSCSHRLARGSVARWADTPRWPYAVRRALARGAANPLLLPVWVLLELLSLPVLALLWLLGRGRLRGGPS